MSGRVLRRALTWPSGSPSSLTPLPLHTSLSICGRIWYKKVFRGQHIFPLSQPRNWPSSSLWWRMEVRTNTWVLSRHTDSRGLSCEAVPEDRSGDRRPYPCACALPRGDRHGRCTLPPPPPSPGQLTRTPSVAARHLPFVTPVISPGYPHVASARSQNVQGFHCRSLVCASPGRAPPSRAQHRFNPRLHNLVTQVYFSYPSLCVVMLLLTNSVWRTGFC